MMREQKEMFLMLRRGLLFISLGFFSVVTVNADSSITFNLKDAELSTVIATVSEFTGKNFIIDPRVKGKVTIISSRPMDKKAVYQVFLTLLEVHNFAAVPSGSVIKIVPAVNAKQSTVPVATKRYPGAGSELVTQIIEVKHVSASQLVPILRPLVPQQGHMAAYAPSNVLIVSDHAANVARLMEIIERIDISNASDVEVYPLLHASAAEVVRILETLRQQEKRADPKAATTNTIVLVADERTNSILISGSKAKRLGVRALIAHLDTPLESSGNTQVIYLHYAKAEDIVPVLSGISDNYKQKKGVAKKGVAAAQTAINIQAHESTNSIVVTGPPDLIRSLQTVISKLDIRRAQVLVETVIAEVSVSRSAELGVQWLIAGSPGNNGPVMGSNFGTANNIIGIAAAAIDNGVPAIGPGALLGFGRFGGDGINFAGLITALEGDGDSNVLSTPNIVTLDNEEAEIVVGQNVPFLTGSYTSTGGGSSTPSNPFQTINRENVGITLKVTPQINEGDAIRLDIEQTVDSLSASSVGAADLITNTRSIKTTVMVDDGGVIVLGGLIKEDLLETTQKVPFLGDIPVLGGLFRHKTTSKEKTNLMIFLHPVILRDAATSSRVTHSKYNFIRAQQLVNREQGVGLMDDNVVPVLPTLQEFMELPPPFVIDDIEKAATPVDDSGE